MQTGKHWIGCKERFPNCPCVSCARDNADSPDAPCCDMHCLLCENGKECPDYIPEEKA